MATLTGAVTAGVLAIGAVALYALPGARSARRWEFHRWPADGADAAAVLALYLAAVSAVRPWPGERVVAAAAGLASLAQAALLTLVTPPVPRVGWSVAGPLWAAAAGPAAGAGAALVVRATARTAEEGLGVLRDVRYRFRDV